MGFLSSLFGVGSRTPKTETVVQAQKLPEEISPFVKEILKEAQDLYKGEIGRGYDPYTGQMIAPLTGDELQAMEGISGLVGTTKPYIEEALDIQREGAEKFTPETAKEYMSPYQRAVTDIEKREAQTAFERTARPAFEKRAVDAGGMSGLGTRAGVMIQGMVEMTQQPPEQIMEDAGGGLMQLAAEGEFQGRVPGEGHGMEDNVYMPIKEGEEQVATLAVSPTEYVVDSHTMAALGNGNPNEGANVMDDVVKHVRKKAYGTDQQPNEINGLDTLRPMIERV